LGCSNQEHRVEKTVPQKKEATEKVSQTIEVDTKRPFIACEMALNGLLFDFFLIQSK
jgi:hypothetical protein